MHDLPLRVLSVADEPDFFMALLQVGPAGRCFWMRLCVGGVGGWVMSGVVWGAREARGVSVRRCVAWSNLGSGVLA